MQAAKNHILPWVLLFLLSCTTQESTKINPKAEKIKELVTYFHENGMFNGTILVSEGGTTIYRQAFGYADFESQHKLTPETRFYLASVSKQFTHYRNGQSFSTFLQAWIATATDKYHVTLIT